MNGLLTTKQAAEKLGVTPGRVRQMIVDGHLPATKMGRDNFIKEADLKLVEKRKVGRPSRVSISGEGNNTAPAKVKKGR